MNRRGLKPTWRDFIKKVEKAGCVCSITNGGHIRIECPSGAIVHAPQSPSNPRRSANNTTSELRKRGVDL